MGYEAQSLIDRRRVQFTPERIWREVFGLLERRAGSYTDGQEVFYSIPYFANALFFVDDWTADMLEDFDMAQTCGVPLAATLDELPCLRSAAFAVIQAETRAAAKMRSELDRKKAKHGR